MMEFDLWPAVFMGAALYMLVGVLFYVLVESRQNRVGYFGPIETLILILSWPTCIIWLLVDWIKRLGYFPRS